MSSQTEGFITKDSGQRQAFASGMVRDTQDGKPRYDLIDLPMLKRWAELMGRGAVKYGENNWKQATGQEEARRFRASAFRHFMQWMFGVQMLDGDDPDDYVGDDEDHAAAVLFNIAGFERVKRKLPKNEALCQPGLTAGRAKRPSRNHASSTRRSVGSNASGTKPTASNSAAPR